MADPGIWRRIGGLLAGARWFQRFVYTAFNLLYQRRQFRYLCQVVLIYLIHATALRVVGFHQISSDPEYAPLLWGIPGVVVFLAVLIIEMPIGVVAKYEERARARDSLVARELVTVLSRAIKGARALTTVEATESLLRCLNNARRPVYLLTPNAMYIFADRFRDRLKGLVEDPDVGDTIEALARSAPIFQDRLLQMPASLHWIMPDPYNDEVRIYLKERARVLRLSENQVAWANKKAAKWVLQLRRQRKRKGWQTQLHFIRCVPGHRLMLTEDRCFLQAFPQRSPALTQPVYVIEARTKPDIFAAVRLALSVWIQN